MTLSNSIFAVSGKASFLDARADMSNLFVCDNNLRPHAGVLSVARNDSSDGALVVGMNNKMAVQVLPFQAVLNRLGALLIMNDGIIEVPIDVAPSSNSRIDVVYLKQNESRSPFSDGTDGPVIGVVKGTAGVSPSVPLVPDGAIELAQVKVQAGATTTSSKVVITQSYPFAATRGEELRFRSLSDLQSFAATDGTNARNLSDDSLYVRENGAWVKIDNSIPNLGVEQKFTLSPSYGTVSVSYIRTSQNSALMSVSASGLYERDWGNLLLGTVNIPDTILLKSYGVALKEGTSGYISDVFFYIDKDKKLYYHHSSMVEPDSQTSTAIISLAVK